MWVVSSMAQQHKLLLLWTGRLSKRASISRVDSHHVSASLLCAEGSGPEPAVKRRRRSLVTSGGQQQQHHQHVASDGWQKQERSAQSKAWKRESPELQRSNQRRAWDSKMSSELSRLSLDDFPAEREKMMEAQKERRMCSVQKERGQKERWMGGVQKERMIGVQKDKMIGVQKDRMRPSEDYEVVFGVAPCLLALTQGRRTVRKLFVKDGEASHRESVLAVCEEAHRRGIHVQRVSKRDLDKMSSGRVHQGVCLKASPLGYLAEDGDSTAATGWMDPPLWLVLERVQDPMNLGAILRSAYFLGADRVISSTRHSCPLSPVVSKASSGVMEVSGVYGYENLEHMLKLKAARGWQVVGTVGAEAGESSVPIIRCSDFQMTKPTLLLMGGEGEGLSRQLLALCQTLITVPSGRELFPGVESLNVSVASGILLHSLLSSRRLTGRRADADVTSASAQDVSLDPLERKGGSRRTRTRTERSRLLDPAAVKLEVF